MSKDKQQGIYKILNTVNNKVYIGSTSNFERRKKQHRKALDGNKHRNKYLQSSYNKHGRDNFEIIFIESTELPKLFEKETYWIKHFKSLDSKFGYNACLPSQIPANRFTGYLIESYDNITGATIEVYENILDASQKLKLNPESIRKVLCEARKQNKGHYFRYKDERKRRKVSYEIKSKLSKKFGKPCYIISNIDNSIIAEVPSKGAARRYRRKTYGKMLIVEVSKYNSRVDYRKKPK